MDFLLSDEQRMARDAARQFAQREIAPLAGRMDAEERFDPDLLAKLARFGYFGMSIPAEHGGSFSDHLTSTLITAELARGCAATATLLGASTGLFGANVAAHGTPEQCARYLPAVAAGEKIGCMALTEPNAGSDATSLRTRAARSGDHYLLNGTKTFISNAPIADVALVYATLDPDKGRKGISAFIVERGFKGYGVGRSLDKLGLRAAPTGEIVLEDCEVPAENLLGMEPGRGFKQMLRGLNSERVGWSAIACGLARSAFGAAFDYARQREQFGAAIVSFQLVQDLLARMSTDVTLGEQSCQLAALMMDRGRDIALAAAQTKLFCGEMVTRVANDALQVLGGYGYMREYPLERYLRDARVFAIGAGTSQIQKLLIVQKLLSQGID